MAHSPAAASRVKLGTCRVSYAGVDLGFTKGGVEVTVTTETYKVMVDQLGNTELDEYITGRSASVKVPLAETDLDKLFLAIPGSQIVNGTNGKRKLKVNTAVGRSLRANGGKLILHPVGMPDNDTSEDFVIPLCSPKGEFTFGFKLNEERIYPIDFTAYANLEDGVLFYFGDDIDDDGEVTPPETGNSIFNTGSWSDTGVWDDNATWKDS